MSAAGGVGVEFYLDCCRPFEREDTLATLFVAAVLIFVRVFVLGLQRILPGTDGHRPHSCTAACV